MIRRLFIAASAAAALVVSFGTAMAEGQRILVQSTTSTQNSGLYDHLLPIFEARTGENVAVVAVGTGQAIRNAEDGDADVLLVHAKAAEEAFVASVASCHMLTFLALCAKYKHSVLRYRDEAVGVLEKNDAGRMAITRVTLNPQIEFAGEAPDAAAIEKMIGMTAKPIARPTTMALR